MLTRQVLAVAMCVGSALCSPSKPTPPKTAFSAEQRAAIRDCDGMMVSYIENDQQLPRNLAVLAYGQDSGSSAVTSDNGDVKVSIKRIVQQDPGCTQTIVGSCAMSAGGRSGTAGPPLYGVRTCK